VAQGVGLLGLAARGVVKVGGGAGGSVAASQRLLAAGEIVGVLGDVAVLVGFRDDIVAEVVGFGSLCAVRVVGLGEPVERVIQVVNGAIAGRRSEVPLAPTRSGAVLLEAGRGR
jgi:hypothetical protein